MPTKHQPPMDRTHEDEHTSNLFLFVTSVSRLLLPHLPFPPLFWRWEWRKMDEENCLEWTDFTSSFTLSSSSIQPFRNFPLPPFFSSCGCYAKAIFFATVTCKMVCYSKTNRFGDHYSGISWSENNLWIDKIGWLEWMGPSILLMVLLLVFTVEFTKCMLNKQHLVL